MPDTTYRVDSCPEANNITAWKKASLRLNCSEYSETYSEEVIVGKKLYHCLSSSFLNETIEFCGPNAAIEKGLCVLISFILSSFILSHMQTISPGHGCVYLSIYVVAKKALIRMILWTNPMHDFNTMESERRCYTTSGGVAKIGRVHYSESSLESWSHLILIFFFIYLLQLVFLILIKMVTHSVFNNMSVVYVIFISKH